MSRSSLADRLCRPHRVGLFGHRGVGKTTLLTVLYREAVSGRLPGLRLAAAEALTADYLADKLKQLEAGETLPATLAETDLHFHLYRGSERFDLLLRDYQGEHVELGRETTIREFLRDCDAVWLCLDLAQLPDADHRLRRQQEIEQLIEDYLASEPRPTTERPVALLLTKADLLPEPASDLDVVADRHFGMTRHALAAHCPENGLFAVSALGEELQQPLAEPLAWLADALQRLDQSRLERLWTLARGDVALLERCVACFAQRYPDAPATADFQQRLRQLQQQRRRRRWAAGLAGAACLLVGLWGYDALGYQAVQRVTDDPALALQHWEDYRVWHPTRQLTGVSHTEQEDAVIADLNRQLRDRQRDARLAELRRQAADPDANPEAGWQLFQEFRALHPEVDVDGDLEALRAAMKARRDEQFNRRAYQSLDELRRAAEGFEDLPALLQRADGFLAEFAESKFAAEARQHRSYFAQRLDERDIQTARDYSTKQPLNFQTRREHYQRYLEKHPVSGAFVQEANLAIRTIDADWDKHDFRGLRDQYRGNPGNVTHWSPHARRYLSVHPQGKFKAIVTELLRWGERVSVPGEYRVVLKNGEFEKSAARWFTRGPKLSVEVEVNGIRYGPSTIVNNSYQPEWEFEFPRRIRWKLGDPVVIRVVEHSWSEKVILELNTPENDPLALWMLSGEVATGGTRLTFSSDFSIPTLPAAD
ncbi:MAG: GTPase domain-containing protein [Planctomycetia bacterium]|nr:GTPase domain-containing protein [Planctomycetia bacterium]